MAGLCEGGNEPPGSLKASKVFLKKEKVEDLQKNIHYVEDIHREFYIDILQSCVITRLRDFGPNTAVQWEIRITAC
ncbi:hypothetical protein ANN_09333 [Periplaneta americana]|uniref:Uncharacterized protein n=1 Tax=Periplaneta americana TaxID=6978 RepID=A0ABQ8TLE3_PERAM|nr:hypothetical protein ANN_09333 [Periplaneta americana]